MKKTIIIFFFLLNLVAISQPITFNKVYNPYNNNNARSYGAGIQKKGNGYITVASSQDTILSLKRNVLFNEIDSAGNIIKIITFAKDSFDFYGGGYETLIQTSDGGYFTPCSITYNDTNSDHYLIRFDANMDTLWTKTIDHDTVWEVYYQSCETYDKGFAMVGLRVITSTIYNVLITKTDSMGNKLWEKTITLGNYSIGGQIKETPDKGLLISGYRSSDVSGSGDPFIIKLDSEGNLLWYRILGTPGQKDGGASFAITPQGDYLVAYGYSTYTYPWPVDDSYDCYLNVMKIGNNGYTIWSRLYDTLRVKLNVTKIQILPDNDFEVMGFYYQTNIGFANYFFPSFIFKFKENGDSLNRRLYYYADNNGDCNLLRDNIINDDGSMVAIGEVNGFSIQPRQQIWIIKIDSNGYAPGPQNYVGIIDLPYLQVGYGGMKVYPNPAATHTTITYKELNQQCQLQIYNLLGQLIYEEKLSKGSSQTTINTIGFKQGLYKVVVGERSETLIIN